MRILFGFVAVKAMETIKDLIEEAKVRTVWWALCIFAVAYFLSREYLKHVHISHLSVGGIYSDCA